jgi:glycosyltransferase involved in cell wall biosynthesis
LDETDIVALYAGALVPEKGVDRAIADVSHTPPAHLVIAGDGPERASLEELAARHAAGRVRFLGGVGDLSAVYRAADVLLLPSRGGDSMPAVLIEAGLVGLPTATTDVGAIPDVVLNGLTGVVTDHSDDAAFVTAASQLLEDAAERQRLGAAARSHCREHFTIEAIAPLWLDVLSAAIAKPR